MTMSTVTAKRAALVILGWIVLGLVCVELIRSCHGAEPSRFARDKRIVGWQEFHPRKRDRDYTEFLWHINADPVYPQRDYVITYTPKTQKFRAYRVYSKTKRLPLGEPVDTVAAAASDWEAYETARQESLRLDTANDPYLVWKKGKWVRVW